MAVCYRHKDRETGVSCSNCGNPICPDCMTATPVGMRCPDCSRQRTQVRTIRNVHGDPTATYVLIAINVLLFVGTFASGGSSSAVYGDLALVAAGIDETGSEVGVAAGEWWRLVTGGFLHAPNNPLHILFNMYVLYWLGTMLEPVLGRARFLGLYFASLLAGSFGAILLTEPNRATVGASGAVFGLMAAAFVLQRMRGINPMQSGIGPVILLNLGITFLIPNISIGGHIGGLIGGALAAFAIERLGAMRRSVVAPVLACVGIAVASIVAAVLVSSDKAAEIGLAAAGLLA
ncbi:MAG: rhomboid family intramembrane serine protease [Solirubrobacteraceae bacterium]